MSHPIKYLNKSNIVQELEKQNQVAIIFIHVRLGVQWREKNNKQKEDKALERGGGGGG